MSHGIGQDLPHTTHVAVVFPRVTCNPSSHTVLQNRTVFLEPVQSTDLANNVTQYLTLTVSRGFTLTQSCHRVREIVHPTSCPQEQWSNLPRMFMSLLCSVSLSGFQRPRSRRRARPRKVPRSPHPRSRQPHALGRVRRPHPQVSVSCWGLLQDLADCFAKNKNWFRVV